MKRELLVAEKLLQINAVKLILKIRLPGLVDGKVLFTATIESYCPIHM
jgi:hypothetical protein